MKIALDLDGVLCDFVKAAFAQIRKTYRPDLPLDYVGPTAYSFSDVLEPGQFVPMFNTLLEQDQFWVGLDALQENLDALLDYVRSYGEENIYYITARPDCPSGSAAAMTQLWLMDRGLSFANLIVVKNAEEKEKHLRELGIKYFLDDYGKTVQQCQAIEGLKTYLLDAPWNQGIDVPRVYSMAEFLMAVELDSALLT